MYSNITGSDGGSYSESSCRGPSPPPGPLRRRSHRPRGCRGGRKNRKNKQAAAAAVSVANSILPNESAFSERQNHIQANFHNFHTSPLKKGDLSPYQHVNTSKPLMAWTGEYQSIAPSSIQNRQMLPPPMFLNDEGRSTPNAFPKESQHKNGYELKMLPSFDTVSESIIPAPPPEYALPVHEGRRRTPNHCSFVDIKSDSLPQPGFSMPPSLVLDRFFLGNEEASTVETVSSSEGSVDGCNWPNAGCPASNDPFESKSYSGGSLFVTSPRSFLFGSDQQAFSNSDSSHSSNARVSVW